MASTGTVTPSHIIDSAIDSKDHLTCLPAELQHHVIGYLYSSHEPDKAFAYESDDSERLKPASHPLDYLAATCKSIRAEVMSWSLHFLLQHQDITKYKPLKTAKLQAQRNFLRGRGGLLTWSEKHCVFCGKKSSRSAILMNGLHCCASCDTVQWPNKITKTDAKREYDLRDDHLLPQQRFTPSLARLLAKHPGGLPKLRYGTYISSNVQTTMFLRNDVEALARFAHGDLKEHLAKKQADRDERRRKAKEAKAKRDEEAAAEAATKAQMLEVLQARLDELTQPRPIPDEVLAHEEEMLMLCNEASFMMEFEGIQVCEECPRIEYEPVNLASLCGSWIDL